MSKPGDPNRQPINAWCLLCNYRVTVTTSGPYRWACVDYAVFKNRNTYLGTNDPKLLMYYEPHLKWHDESPAPKELGEYSL